MRLRATDGLCLALAMLWLGVHSASSLAQSDPNDSLKPRRVSLEPRDDVEQQADVVYAAYGERQVKLDLFLPRNEETGRSAVVVVHGGGWLQGDRTRFHALAQALAARGFVTAAIEYRLGGEAKFPAAIHDCNAAVRWLRANAERLRVDPQKIGAVGGSAGGHLVALMAAAPQVASLQGDGGNGDQSSVLQAAVVMAGPLELATGPVAERSRTGGDSSNANRWFGKTIDEAPELYELASPYTHLSERTPPMLFMAGEFDQPQRNVASRDRLRSFKVKTDVFAYADGKHGCWNQHPWFEPMVDDVDAFLSEALKKSPRADDTRPLAMPWGELHRLADRLELRLASLPESASGVSINVPRFNNPVGPIFIKGDESKQPLTLKPGLTDWTIELPKSVAAGESDMTIVVETVGRPYLPTLPRIVSSAAEGDITLAAHDAVTHGKLLRYEPQPHKNTIGYWANADDWCEWRFYAERSGRFGLRVLQGCGKGHGGSRVAVSIGEQEVEFTVEDTGHFQNFRDREIGEVTLPEPGVYRLRIKPIDKAAGAVMDVRQVRLQRLGDA